MGQALSRAQRCIRLESYTVAEGLPGVAIRDYLVAAALRGVRVQVLVDGLGSYSLPISFWKPLEQAGGLVRVFNPLSFNRLMVRDHRKLIVVDDSIAIVGGFNIASVYLGDGISRGWCNVGVCLTGSVADRLSIAFDRMWDLAVESPLRFVRLRRRTVDLASSEEQKVGVIVSGPGRGGAAFLVALRKDLERAEDVQIVCPYFLPGLRLRRMLARMARDGKKVRILVPGRSDVPMSRRAGRSLYSPLLRAGVEILEYQPQVLHAKLYLTEAVVFVGSSNLDTRSLHINHEIMLRIEHPEVVAKARDWVGAACRHAQRIETKTWRQSRSWVEKIRERWAHLLLSRFDPYVTRWMVQDPR